MMMMMMGVVLAVAACSSVIVVKSNDQIKLAANGKRPELTIMLTHPLTNNNHNICIAPLGRNFKGAYLLPYLLSYLLR